MAFPTEVGTTTTGNGSGTSATITLPSGIQAGERIQVFFSNDANSTSSITTPTSGWSTIVDGVLGNGNTPRGYVWERIADGGEDSTITVTISSNEGFAWIARRISGAHASTISEGASTAASLDPPSLNPTGWDTEDTLWTAVVFWDSNDAGPASYPTDFDLYQNSRTGNNAQGSSVAVASRELNAASIDPGTFGSVGGEESAVATIATRPSSVSTLTKTHTTDSLILKTLSKTNSIESLLSKQFGLSVVVESLLGEISAVDSGIETLLKKTISVSSGIDARILDVPYPILRGTSSAQQQVSVNSLDITVNSTCTGKVLVWAYISKSGTGDLGNISSITSPGLTSWTLLGKGNDTGPRTGLVIELEGTFTTSDVITITFVNDIGEWFVHLLDWQRARDESPFVRYERSTSIANNTSHTGKHQRPLYSKNSILGQIFTGGGSNAISIDQGNILGSIAPDPGVSAVTHFWIAEQFSDYNVLASWTGTWSNLGQFIEVAHTDSPFGSSAVRPKYLDQTASTSGSTFLTGSVQPSSSSVVIFYAYTERSANSDSLSSVAHDASGTPINFSEKAKISIDADHQLHVWSKRFGTSPVNAAITATATLAQTEWVTGVIEITNVGGVSDTDWGLTPVTDSGSSVTSLELSLGTLNAKSGVIALWAQNGPSNFTAENGYVGVLHYAEDGFDGIQIGSIYATWLGNSNDNTASVSIGSSSNLAGIAIEVVSIASTITHNIDAFLTSVQTKTHSIDAVLLNRPIVSNSLDASILKTQIVTHFIESLAVKQQVTTHSVDTLLLKQQIIMQSVDSLILKTLQASHSIESLLLKQLTQTNQIDSLLLKTLSVTNSLDSLLQKALAVSHSIDSLLQKTLEATHTIDTLLLKTLEQTHQIDSLLIQQRLVTNNIDALLAAGTTAVHSIDANLQKTLTVSQEIDNLLLKIQQQAHSIDALLNKQQTQTHEVDALLRKELTTSHEIDSLLLKVQILTHSVDGLVNKQQEQTHSIDSLLQKMLGVTHEVDTLLNKSLTQTHSVDALLTTGTSVNQDIESFIVKTLSVTHSQDSLIQKTQSIAHSIDSLLLKQQSISHEINSLIQKTLSLAQELDSLIQKTFVVAQSIDSLLNKTLTQSQSMDAILTAGTVVFVSIDTLLNKTLSVSCSIDALILETQIASHSIDVLIPDTNTQTHQIDSSLLQVNSETHDIDGLLRKTLSVEFATESLIEKEFIQSHSLDSFIRQASFESHDIDAILNKTNIITNSIDGLVEKEFTIISSIDSLILQQFSTSHGLDVFVRSGLTVENVIDALLRKTLVETHSIDIFVGEYPEIHPETGRLDTSIRPHTTRGGGHIHPETGTGSKDEIGF